MKLLRRFCCAPCMMLFFLCVVAGNGYSQTPSSNEKTTENANDKTGSDGPIEIADLKALLGKKIFCEEMQSLILKIGKDPQVRIIPREDAKGLEGRFEYYWKDLGVTINCDPNLEIESCRLFVPLWKGALPFNISRQDSIDDVKEKCGIPTEDQRGFTGVNGSFAIYKKEGFSVWFEPTEAAKEKRLKSRLLLPKSTDYKENEVLDSIVLSRVVPMNAPEKKK